MHGSTTQYNAERVAACVHNTQRNAECVTARVHNTQHNAECVIVLFYVSFASIVLFYVLYVCKCELPTDTRCQPNCS
jgi:hypothetical protein